MNYLIDTHCHLGDDAFDQDRDEVMARMRVAGVGRALVVESELSRLDATREWLGPTDGLALATGCHPHDASKWSVELAARLESVWRGGGVAAAGEMGLDYHYNHSPREVQMRVFDHQVGLATDCGLPVVIHAREADEDVAAVLRGHPRATVVLHSFSSGAVLRDAALAANWYLSFSGMVTFKSWADHESVASVAEDRLLVETDSPYLAPVPHRGKRNEPAFVVDVAKRVAAIRGATLGEVVELTTDNAMRLFWPA